MNPSGLCLCGCGEKTKLSDRNRPKYGHIKGQPVDYIMGHFARTPHGQILIRSARSTTTHPGPIRLKRKRSAMAVADKVEETLQARRTRTQKQGPYKAGATLKAKAAVGKIEAALRRKR